MTKQTLELIQTCLLIGASISFIFMLTMLMTTMSMSSEASEREFKRYLLIDGICAVIFLFCGIAAYFIR